jgi:hypothetical protein
MKLYKTHLWLSLTIFFYLSGDYLRGSPVNVWRLKLSFAESLSIWSTSSHISCSCIRAYQLSLDHIYFYYIYRFVILNKYLLNWKQNKSKHSKTRIKVSMDNVKRFRKMCLRLLFFYLTEIITQTVFVSLYSTAFNHNFRYKFPYTIVNPVPLLNKKKKLN